MTKPDAREGQAGRPGGSERFIVPPMPGNAGGGTGPQFKTNATRSEGPGDWATYQLRRVFRNCRLRCTRKRRQKPAIASTPCTTRSAARTFWPMPMLSAAVVRQARPAHSTEAAAPRDAGEPLMAIVSIKSQHVTIYDAEGWILRAPVSSGTTGRETPAGVFSVVQKDKDHHSNLYDDASMPNMQRITWSGIAMHGGPLPGYAASHGCVRLPYDFAEKLFDKTQIGMRVIIAPNDAEPVAFSDPALFVPNSEALADAPARAETLAREAADAANIAKSVTPKSCSS